MRYTVHQLAKIAGISVRTLHYYDEIGLLKPARTIRNGYRHYGSEELLKLQQILFFRELEFPLAQIKTIMAAPGFDRQTALTDQRKLLEMKKLRLERLIQTLDQTITNHAGDQHMSDRNLFGGFTDEEAKQYQEEARQRWGNTKAYKQSVQRVGTWTKADWQKHGSQTDAALKAIVQNMEKGIEAPKIQAEIKKLYDLMQAFYDCPPDMFRCLGQMYVDDKRFTAFYDKYDTRLAPFIRDAYAYFADHYQK